jgi:hypothetical protein
VFCEGETYPLGTKLFWTGSRSKRSFTISARVVLVRMALRAGGLKLGWRAKREVLPGGPKGVLPEVALSKQQVLLVKIPHLSTDIAVAAAGTRRTVPKCDGGRR